MFFILLGCAQKESVALREMQFTLNEELVSSAYSDTINKYVINPPLNCQIVSDSIKQAIEKKLQFDIGLDSTKLLSEYFVDHDEAVFFVYSVYKNNFDFAVEEILTILKSEIKELNEDLFLIKGLRTKQFFINKNGFVNIKLIIEVGSNNLVFVDYKVPLNKYTQLSRAVESSIASFKKNNLGRQL